MAGSTVPIKKVFTSGHNLPPLKLSYYKRTPPYSNLANSRRSGDLFSQVQPHPAPALIRFTMGTMTRWLKNSNPTALPALAVLPSLAAYYWGQQARLVVARPSCSPYFCGKL